MLIYLYFALFFISGIAGLIYESVWSHYLKLFLGHAAYAQTLVLVIYMGGMAIGSWIASARSERIRNMLSVYAFVELALGLAAIAFHDLFIQYLNLSYSAIIPLFGSPITIGMYKWVTAACIILPQSILLGATFPLMTAGCIRRFPSMSGYSLSVLYFVNTLGASLGVLLSGFVLIGSFGLRGAMITGGIIDIVVGVSFLLLRRRESATQSGVAPVVQQAVRAQLAPAGEHHDSGQASTLPLLVTAFLTAAASFMYEIGWIRMLSLVLGSATHSFELMLSSFILGLALGSFFIRNRIDRIASIPRAVGTIQVAMGATALMTLFTYGHMFELMRFFMDALARNGEGYVLFNICAHTICLLIMLPSTICAGMVIPLIIHALYAGGLGERVIGRVYALNTFGSIVGVVLAVWLILPLIGVRLLLCIGGAIDMGLGLYVLSRYHQTESSRLRIALTGFSAIMLVSTIMFARLDPVVMASGVFRYGTIARHKRVVSHKDGRTATVALYRDSLNMVLTTNGKPDAAVNVTGGYCSDEYTMAMLAVIPMSVLPRIHTAAVIGVGAGMTSHYMLYDTALSRLDVIEIEPAMARAARRIGPKVSKTFTDPRCRIHYDDAKTFFSAPGRRYDVIISEPSNPWVSGASGLFSQEFFSQIRRNINDGGLLVQWVHTYESDISIIVSVLKALRSSFPSYEIYTFGADMIIIASTAPAADLSLQRNVFTIRPLAANLEKMGFLSTNDLRVVRQANNRILDPFIDTYNYPPNSDFRPFVDLYAVKHRFIGEQLREFDHIRSFIVPLKRIAESDTTAIDFATERLLPELYNMQEFSDAKDLYRNLTSPDLRPDTSGSAGTGAPQFILNYAQAFPSAIPFYQVQSAVTTLLEATLPYLSAAEMRETWSAIARKIDKVERSGNDYCWIQFFEALCDYDQSALAVHARVLLPETAITEHYSNQILLAALLISAVDSEDRAYARDAWGRYELRDDPPAPLRFAKAWFDKSTKAVP